MNLIDICSPLRARRSRYRAVHSAFRFISFRFCISPMPNSYLRVLNLNTVFQSIYRVYEYEYLLFFGISPRCNGQY